MGKYPVSCFLTYGVILFISRVFTADYGGKYLWKRWVLSLDWISECVTEGGSGEQVEINELEAERRVIDTRLRKWDRKHHWVVTDLIGWLTVGLQASCSRLIVSSAICLMSSSWVLPSRGIDEPFTWNTHSHSHHRHVPSPDTVSPCCLVVLATGTGTWTPNTGCVSELLEEWTLRFLT